MGDGGIGDKVFEKASGFAEAASLRRFETRDIVRRVGVIAPHRVFLNNHPVRNPIAVFNASGIVEGDTLLLYARIIVGYYMYVSGIVELRIPLEDVFSASVSANYYAADFVVTPSTKYDIWGAEDPRVYTLDRELYMTYTGRTVNYFNPVVRRERTVPITATRINGNRTWIKRYVHVMPGELRSGVVSDKNAFLYKAGADTWFFHRLHLIDERFYLVISRYDGLPAAGVGREPVEAPVSTTVWVMPHASFEEKVGWAAPPIDLGNGRLIVLLHGVGREMNAYRVFAVRLRLSRSEGVVVEAVTPQYIMEPRMPYETFGDRPYTVFPCGLWRLSSDEAVITYGAADFMVGIGVIDLAELESMLDKGRIY